MPTFRSRQCVNFPPCPLPLLQLHNRIAIPPMRQYSAEEGKTTGWHMPGSLAVCPTSALYPQSACRCEAGSTHNGLSLARPSLALKGGNVVILAWLQKLYGDRSKLDIPFDFQLRNLLQHRSQIQRRCSTFACDLHRHRNASVTVAGGRSKTVSLLRLRTVRSVGPVSTSSTTSGDFSPTTYCMKMTDDCR